MKLIPILTKEAENLNLELSEREILCLATAVHRTFVTTLKKIPRKRIPYRNNSSIVERMVIHFLREGLPCTPRAS